MDRPDGGQVFTIGDWALDLGRQRLQRGTESHPLNPKEIGVLQHLVEAAPDLVTTEQLLERTWPDVVVGDHVVHEVIGRLRKFLGDSAKQPRYIETLRRRGYRLVVPVQRGAAELPHEGSSAIDGAIAGRPEATSASSSWPWRRLLPMVGSLLFIAAAAAWIYFLGDEPHRPATAIAVLPFEDLSPVGDAGWLAGGISETLVTHLTRVEQLRVTPVPSTLDGQGELRRIGERLGVGSLVLGSVQQSGEAFKLTARLVDARSGAERWSADYDGLRGEPTHTQQEVAQAIVRAIESELGLRLPLASADVVDLARYGTSDARAYQLWREALELKFADDATEQDALEALARGREAVSVDPRYVMGWVGVGATHMVLSSWRRDLRDVKQAGGAFERAVELGPHHPVALGNLVVYSGLEWRWARAVELVRQVEPWTRSAIVGNVIRMYVLALINLGRWAEADQIVEELLHIRETFPELLPHLDLELADAIFWVRGDADAAVAMLPPSLLPMKGTLLPPPAGSPPDSAPVSLSFLRPPMWAYLYHAAGHEADAVAAFLTGLSEPDQRAAQQGYAATGWEGMLRGALSSRLERGLLCPERDGHPGVLPSADMHAALGEKEQMYRCLERQLAVHECYVNSTPARAHECGTGSGFSLLLPFWTVPPYNAYLKEPRFQEFLDRAGVIGHRNCCPG